MNSAKTFILFELDQRGVGTITLNRPDLHNAFNEIFISEFVDVIKDARSLANLRLLVVKANGKSFCAGADLHWMKKMAGYSFGENLKDSNDLAELFYQLNSFSAPVLLKLHGHALGGGAGLVACADEVVAADSAELGFTEVRLGLAPAVISPFVVAKIGESFARATFLSGRRIKAEEALRMGLIHTVVPSEELDAIFEKRIKEYLDCAPVAQRKSKDLIKQVVELPRGERRKFTTELISELRISEEGQHGMKSLLEKQKPNWIKE